MNDNGNHSEPKKKRTHIGLSPTNQIVSPYSDDGDNKSDNSNSKSMRFFDIDVEEDGIDVVHDQLPSVEEAKANSHFDATTTRRQRKKKKLRWYVLWGIVIVGVLAALSGSLAMGKQSRYQTAVELVTNTVRLSHQDAFLDPKSPQSQALQWMLHEDALQLPLPTTRTDPFVQRYVVAVLVFAVTTKATTTTTQDLSSSQQEKKNNTREIFGLLSGVHECEWNSEWNRVEIDGEIEIEINVEGVLRLGIICGFSDETWSDHGFSNQSVTDILFKRSGLDGELPPELELLEHLSRVDLANNQIKGKVPPMPYLTDLSLAYNHLTGYLPDHFSEMTRLRSLSLSENAFQGSLPQKFADLTDLEILALNGNQLTGGLEEVYSLTNLEELYLAYNYFEDHLSNDAFEELSSLRVIDAKDNRLSGPLPDALWKLTHLEVIDFHKNALDGHINNVIAEGHPLKYLDLSRNLLGGGLPSSISNLEGLTHLDVSYNRLDAIIPPGGSHLAGMTKMRTLLLTEDDGIGPQPLPEWLRGMTDLEQLSFRLTSRTGTIPTWFGELTKLELLDLDWNHISGTIPTELGLLTHLRYLMLNRNYLTGTVPTAVSYLPHLKLLMLDTNRFDLDSSVRIGDEDVCSGEEQEFLDGSASGNNYGRIEDLIADCGRLIEGVPTEKEVDCPCCTNCCWDSAQRCNMKDWIIELEEEYRSAYDRYEYDFDDAFYVPVEA
jgi:Leucine-rich repeat (LRR) protein